MEAIVFIILQIFFATHKVFKIGEYSRIFPSFSWEIFDHVTQLDQSRAQIWWIINNSLHLALKYGRIFVRGYYLFWEANSFSKAKLEENCALPGTDNV